MSKGHHPVHAGLQKHSVGDIYPLAVVGYGTADKVVYCVKNLCTGQTAGFRNGPGEFSRREWQHASGAYNYAEKISDPAVNPNFTHDLEWAPPREAATQQDDAHGVSAEERAALMAAVAAVEPPAPEPAPGRWNWSLGPDDAAVHRLDVLRRKLVNQIVNINDEGKLAALLKLA